MDGGFREDGRFGEIAGAYALDAVDHAARYGKLDFSDESVAVVERVLGLLSATEGLEKPGDETVLLMCKMYGCYVGEVYRRNHGGIWGLCPSAPGNSPTPAMKAPRSGTICWPLARVHKRIKEGPEANVEHYYQAWVAKYTEP